MAISLRLKEIRKTAKLTQNDIANVLGMSKSSISHQLGTLRRMNIVKCRKQGKEVYYTAANTQQAQLLHHMIEDLVVIACPSKQNL